MAVQHMKISHTGWVDFTKKLVQLPQPEQPVSKTSPEPSRMEGLRLAIAGVPMSMISLIPSPALANVPIHVAMPTNPEQSRQVEPSNENERLSPPSAATDSLTAMPYSSGRIAVPMPDMLRLREAFTMPVLKHADAIAASPPIWIGSPSLRLAGAA